MVSSRRAFLFLAWTAVGCVGGPISDYPRGAAGNGDDDGREQTPSGGGGSDTESAADAGGAHTPAVMLDAGIGPFEPPVDLGDAAGDAGGDALVEPPDASLSADGEVDAGAMIAP